MEESLLPIGIQIIITHNETIKITIRFLSNEIRSDALDIKVFYKSCTNDFKCVVKKNNWDYSH